MKTTFKFQLIPIQTIAVSIILLAATAAASASEAVWTAIVGTSADTNWSDSANWESGVAPSGNACLFNDATGVGANNIINNVVDTSEFPLSLTYTNLGTFQNTLILPGQTLTIGTNGLTLGQGSVQLAANPPNTPTTTISGGDATLIASNDTVTIGYEYQSTAFSSGASAANINMSGLDTFIVTNGAHIYIGEGNVRMSGALYLATNNFIYFTGASASSSPNLDIGDNLDNNGPGAYLYLGQSNIFYINDIGIGLKKQNSGNSTMSFNSAFNNPVAYFYGTNGPGSLVSTWAIGDGQTASGTITDQGTANFSGGTVYAWVNDMWLGRNSTANSGSGPTSSGTLTFSAGTISVNYLTNGWIQGTAEGPISTGTINVNGTGVLNVNNNLVMAATNNNLTGTTTFECQGEMNITGGSVLANKITAGGGGDDGSGYNAYIDMTGGLLAVTNTLGTPTYPLNEFYYQDSPTLQLSAASGTANWQIEYFFSDDGSPVNINVSSVPIISTYPTALPLITYQDGSGSGISFNLTSMPGAYTGYISNDNNSTVWLVVTNGPALPKLDQWGGGVNDNWDTTTLNWTNNGVAVNYNENDSVFFNDQAQSATVNLTSTHTPLAWSITNNALNYIFTGSGIAGDVGLNKYGTASVTLSESGDSFSGGVSVNDGTVILDQPSSSISGGLNIASGATAQIGNNDINGALPSGALADNGTLAYDQTAYTLLSTAISGAGGLTQAGSGTLALSAGNTYTGNTLVSAGTLALTNSGSLFSSAAVTVNNGTLDVSGISGTVALNNLSLANGSMNVSLAYLQTPVSVTGLTLGGSGNTINVASLPPIAGYPSTMTIIQSASSVSGSDVSLGTLPAASPSYAGSVSVSGNQVILTLTSGPTGVRPNVTWSGADAINQVSTNWTDNTNWLSPIAPTAADNVIFNGTAAQSASALSTPGGGASDLVPANVNNIVNANFTIASLLYTNIGGYQNTYINSGDVLAITNSGTNTILSVGSGSVDFGSTAQEYATISGPDGALDINNTNDTVFVGMITAGAGTELGTLDMSALGNFNATVNSFAVGAAATTSDGAIGTAYLAQTNVITAVGGVNSESSQDETLSLMVGETGKNGAGMCYLYLGQQNVLNVNYIGVCIAKEPAEMQFNPIWTNPSATIRGANGGPVTVWAIGDGLAQTGASTTPVGIADFTGGTVNALVTTMYIGRSPDASGPHPATGTLNFDAGTFAAGTIYNGYQAYDTSDNGVGAINVSGTGILQVGALDMAWTTGGESSPTTGALNITNATAELGSVVCDANKAGQGTINMVNGTLVITNTAGSAGTPLTALNLAGGTLQLDVNGAANATNVVATSVTTSGATTLQIGSLAGVTTGVTYPLIAYTGTDPFSSLSLALPAGYVGSLVDNSGVVGLTLTTVPVSQPPRFIGISVSGSTLNISGTNGAAGGSFVLLETTNLASPIHWTPVLTNSFNSNGGFSLSTNVITPATPDEFYTITNLP